MTVIILFKAPWIFSWFKPGTGTILCSCSYYSFLLCALISLSYYTLISCNLQLWLGDFLAVTFSNVWGMLLKYFKSSSQSLKEPLFLVFQVENNMSVIKITIVSPWCRRTPSFPFGLKPFGGFWIVSAEATTMPKEFQAILWQICSCHTRDITFGFMMPHGTAANHYNVWANTIETD